MGEALVSSVTSDSRPGETGTTGAGLHAALYIGSLSMGGAERVMVNLAEALYARGWRVTLVTTYLAEEEYEVPHGLWRRVSAEGSASEQSFSEGGLVGTAVDSGERADSRVIRVLTPEEREISVALFPWRPSGESGTGRDIGAPGNGIDRYFSGVASREVRTRREGFSLRWNRLGKIWQDIKPDVILSFIGKNNFMALLTARKHQIPVVVSVRATPLEEYPTIRMRVAANTLFPRAASVVLQTAGAAAFFAPRVRRRAVVLPNAVGEEFLSEKPAGEAREKSIVMVGRLDANKNVGMLFTCFAELRKEKTADGWRLFLYGDGEDRSKLEGEAQRLGIGGLVSFMGQQRGIADRIRQAGIYCLLSGREGMPNALIEAMCLGIPCITTDCVVGGIAQFVKDGENALVIPPGDEAALTEALKRLMREPALAERLGENAASLREQYRPERVYEAWERLLVRAAVGTRE